jgi:hypothetical protein
MPIGLLPSITLTSLFFMGISRLIYTLLFMLSFQESNWDMKQGLSEHTKSYKVYFNSIKATHIDSTKKMAANVHSAMLPATLSLMSFPQGFL